MQLLAAFFLHFFDTVQKHVDPPPLIFDIFSNFFWRTLLKVRKRLFDKIWSGYVETLSNKESLSWLVGSFVCNTFGFQSLECTPRPQHCIGSEEMANIVGGEVVQ